MAKKNDDLKTWFAFAANNWQYASKKHIQTICEALRTECGANDQEIADVLKTACMRFKGEHPTLVEVLAILTDNRSFAATCCDKCQNGFRMGKVKIGEPGREYTIDAMVPCNCPRGLKANERMQR